MKIIIESYIYIRVLCILAHLYIRTYYEKMREIAKIYKFKHKIRVRTHIIY